jgi:hypothetical protein
MRALSIDFMQYHTLFDQARFGFGFNRAIARNASFLGSLAPLYVRRIVMNSINRSCARGLSS